MQMGLEKVLHLTSRTGRELQRYKCGRRQVVGCIPYRYVESPSVQNLHELEVLMVSSQKGKTMMFPKGGWESDESIEEAASRESLEEAGVTGTLDTSKLGEWEFKSKSQDKIHDGHMFALHVKKLLHHWPEQNSRQRTWVKVKEAKELCPYPWMKAALDRLVTRLSVSPPPSKPESAHIISSGLKRFQVLRMETSELDNVISTQPSLVQEKTDDSLYWEMRRHRTNSPHSIVSVQIDYMLPSSQTIGYQPRDTKNQIRLFILLLEVYSWLMASW